MTAQEALCKIKKAIEQTPQKGDRWSLRLHKRWKKCMKLKKGMRVPEYETFLVKDIDCCFLYATQILRNRLPDRLHRAMIAQGIADPNNRLVKIYMNMLEELESGGLFLP